MSRTPLAWELGRLLALPSNDVSLSLFYRKWQRAHKLRKTLTQNLVNHPALPFEQRSFAIVLFED